MADGHSFYHITETLLVPRDLPSPLWQMTTAFIISQRCYWCLLHLLMLLPLHLAATASVAAAAASLLCLLMLLRLLTPAAATPRGVARYSSGGNASHWPVFQPMSRLIFLLHVRRLLLLLLLLQQLRGGHTTLPPAAAAPVANFDILSYKVLKM